MDNIFLYILYIRTIYFSQLLKIDLMSDSKSQTYLFVQIQQY